MVCGLRSRGVRVAAKQADPTCRCRLIEDERVKSELIRASSLRCSVVGF